VFGEICSYFEKALILFALFIFSSASAVELQHYRMSHGLVFETLEDTKIDNSHVMNNYRTLFTAGYSWANEPLVFKSVNNNFGDNSQVIKDMQTLHIGIGHYLNERLIIQL
jgi:predicted permease